MIVNNRGNDKVLENLMSKYEQGLIPCGILDVFLLAKIYLQVQKGRELWYLYSKFMEIFFIFYLY